MRISNNITLFDRIISATTYLTAGGVGFVWLIISALMKKNVSQFMMFNIMQSIFISILFFILQIGFQLVYSILYRIPLINAIPFYLSMPIPILFGLSIVQAFTTFIILYLAIVALLGGFSYLPWVSDVIRGNTRR